MSTIKTSVVRRCGPFVDHAGTRHPGIWSGRITIVEDGRRIWAKTCTVQRTDPKSALEDARIMRDDKLLEVAA